MGHGTVECEFRGRLPLLNQQPSLELAPAEARIKTKEARLADEQRECDIRLLAEEFDCPPDAETRKPSTARRGVCFHIADATDANLPAIA
jgi:hypothetical protein